MFSVKLRSTSVTSRYRSFRNTVNTFFVMLVDDAINHAIHPILKCKQTADKNVNKVTSIKNDLYAHFMEKIAIFVFFNKNWFSGTYWTSSTSRATTSNYKGTFDVVFSMTSIKFSFWSGQGLTHSDNQYGQELQWKLHFWSSVKEVTFATDNCDFAQWIYILRVPDKLKSVIYVYQFHSSKK